MTSREAGMESSVSDRSREYSLEALQRLEEIQGKYKTCPVSENLSEEDNALLLRKIIQLGNAVAATKYKKFSFYEDAVKNARNLDAHSVKDDVTVINGIYRNVFGWLTEAQVELKRNIEKSYSRNKDIRQFEKFGTAFDSEEKRKAFADSIQSEYYEGGAKASFTEAREEALHSAAISALDPEAGDRKQLLAFAKQQPNLAESIQKEIVEWTEKTNRILDTKNPFIQETIFVEKLGETQASDLQENIAALSAEYCCIGSVVDIKPDINLEFYKNAFAENRSTDEKTKSKKAIAGDNEILSRNILADMQKELVRRRTAWELAQIKKQREDLMKTLYQKLANFKKLLERLKSFTKDFGRLWDLAQGEFNDNGFDVIEQYAGLLQDDEGLTELAKMIGRHYEEERKFHKELRSKIVVEKYYNPEPAYKGEICGLRLSDSLADALPSELALYGNSSSRQIFKMKYAQKQILSYAYSRNVEYQKAREEMEEVDVGEVIDHKGPMIICVDTSGSMRGTPERVAKTVAFALAKKAMEEERGCYLVSFSTGIEVMDLGCFASVDGISNLVKFLRMGFSGGTDANPALAHSVQMLEGKDWKNADVLMISDFVMDSLDKDLEERIKIQRENKSRFFSLAVTAEGNDEVISVFDKNWIYDIQAKDAGAKLVRQLEDIAW